MAETGTRGLVKVDLRSVGTQQEEAIAALLRAPRMEAAAAMAGISEATLREWLDNPGFNKKYHAARQTVIDGVVVRLEQLAGDALEALARNLTCGVPTVEVAAAQVILGYVVVEAERPESGEPARKREQGPGRGGHS